MYAIRSLYLLALFVLAQTTLAVPLDRPSHQHVKRDISEIDNRALIASLSQSVSFNTVTTTQTQSGTITESCEVTLTPITNRNGQQVVRQDKVCRLVVDANNNGNNGNGGNGNGNNENTSTSTSEISTSTSSSFTSTSISTSVSTTETLNTFTSTATGSAGTAPPAVSVIGTGQVPASGTVGPSATLSTTTNAGIAPTSAPPAVSVIGTNQVPATAPAQANGGTETLPVTVVTTLSDGSVSTSVTTPSAAAAQTPEAASVPGRKLEVLPIGLGVFAGISVIALIVVGLVTYERTKYRKAFRQRKLAEAGANMGYGGMAERT